MIQPDILKKIILDNKILATGQLDQIIAEDAAKNLGLESYLIKNKVLTEEMLYQALAKYYQLPYINLREITIESNVLELIPEETATAHQTIAFEIAEDKLKIATLNPGDLQTLEFIKRKAKKNLDIYISSPSQIANALGQYHQDINKEFEEITNRTKTPADIAGTEQLKKLAEKLPVVKIVDKLLDYAIFEGASDIHIEPEEKDVVIRYRIDGILHDVMTLPKDIQSGIVARIKVLSSLKIDEKRLPQDGRFKIIKNKNNISFRVSILPVVDGEKIVMRLLREGSQALSFADLGFQPSALAALEKNIKKPHGMILVTGPTGSGKTTTLYSVLQILNRPEVNISTVEDPIEYRMPRVNQSQVNPKIGFTFAAGLRALLRQDPNIIMVGEIRDEETASIAVNAAMTGHLLLSTLHTNDAVTTLPRLAEMSIPNFLIASTTNIIIAQRLVRRICPYCIMSYSLDEKIIADLKKQFDIDEIFRVMTEQKIIEPGQTLNKMLFSRGKGCAQCHNSGYKGRIGIYEALEITPKISELILKKADTEEILGEAKKEGILTIVEDGFIKAQKGITTIEEILRVTKE